jgi:hypothetical protein
VSVSQVKTIGESAIDAFLAITLKAGVAQGELHGDDLAIDLQDPCGIGLQRTWIRSRVRQQGWEQLAFVAGDVLLVQQSVEMVA